MNELHKLAADLRQAGEKAQQGARLVVEKTTLDIEADAKNLAPVRTGNLRASIGHTYSYEPGAVEAEIGPTASYGAFLEYGTSKMAPRPFMGPALERRAPAFEQLMGRMGGELL